MIAAFMRGNLEKVSLLIDKGFKLDDGSTTRTTTIIVKLIACSVFPKKATTI